MALLQIHGHWHLCWYRHGRWLRMVLYVQRSWTKDQLPRTGKLLDKVHAKFNITDTVTDAFPLVQHLRAPRRLPYVHRLPSQDCIDDFFVHSGGYRDAQRNERFVVVGEFVDASFVEEHGACVRHLSQYGVALCSSLHSILAGYLWYRAIGLGRMAAGAGVERTHIKT